MIDLQEVPTKPRITIDPPRRDTYATTIVLRYRRAWNKMSADERNMVLLQGADALDVLASQMRAEAKGEDDPSDNLL